MMQDASLNNGISFILLGSATIYSTTLAFSSVLKVDISLSRPEMIFAGDSLVSRKGKSGDVIMKRVIELFISSTPRCLRPPVHAT